MLQKMGGNGGERWEGRGGDGNLGRDPAVLFIQIVFYSSLYYTLDNTGSTQTHTILAQSPNLDVNPVTTTCEVNIHLNQMTQSPPLMHFSHVPHSTHIQTITLHAILTFTSIPVSNHNPTCYSNFHIDPRLKPVSNS